MEIISQNTTDISGTPQSVREKYKAGDILSAAIEVGKYILKYGGEINRVEDTIRRICYAYGAVSVEVFAINSLITATVVMPDDTRSTQIRRVLKTENHLSRLEELSNLSREICESDMSPKEAREKIEAIREIRPIPTLLCCLGGSLTTCSFAIFIGGSFMDIVAATLIGFIMTSILQVQRLSINAMASAFILSLCSGMLSGILPHIGIGNSVDNIAIGTIMILIPGLAVSLSLRDLLFGDTLSGTLKLVQSLLSALSVALGYTAALLFCDFVFPPLEVIPASTDVNIILDTSKKLLAACVNAFGYSLISYMRLKRIPASVLGGFVTICVYLGATFVTDIVFIHYLAASFAAAMYVEICARITKAPAVIYLIPSIISLAPGSFLYRAISNMVRGNYDLSLKFWLDTAIIAISISAGLIIASVIWSIISGKPPIEVSKNKMNMKKTQSSKRKKYVLTSSLPLSGDGEGGVNEESNVSSDVHAGGDGS